MKQKFANLGHGYLAQNIDTVETQFYVENMIGAPSISTGEFFVATIYTMDSFYGSNIEIVKVVQTDGNYWTVERNQEESGAKEHPQGSRIELRMTADSIVQVYREGVEDRLTSSERSKTDLGFLPNEKGELQFDAATRTVTLVANDLPVYWFGKELRLNTVSIQFADVAGGRYIKLNPDTLELEEGGEYPGFDVLLVAYIHWSVAQQDFIIRGDERHTVTRNTTWHRYQHLNEGMRWLSGGMPTYMQDDASQVGISLTTPIRVADEDLEHLILHSSNPSNPLEQVLEGSAELPVLWLDSTGHYQANAPTQYPFPYDGTGILVNTINELDSTGSLVAVPNSKFVSMFILASHCSKYPVKIITGRVVSDTVAEARDESLLSYGINMPEFAYLYHLVYEKDDSVTQNPGKVRLAAVMEPARPVNSAAPNISANDHQGLSNRTAPDSHPIGAISGLQEELDKSKEWSAATVTKEEAEATSGETRRAWTVTRVLEAIQAWWNRSTMKIKLDGIQDGAQVNTVTSVAGKAGDVLLTKDDVGLGNVDNVQQDPIVDQAEAEAGEATTRRAFTAQRVRQAIVAWFNGISGELGRTILSSTTAAQVRGDIGLGTAATRDVGTSAGNVMVDGQYGLKAGGLAALANGSTGDDVWDSWDNIISGWGSGTRTGVPAGLNGTIGKVLNIGAQSWGTQLFFNYYGNQVYFRGKESPNSTPNPWRELYHTGNMPATATRWPTWSEVTSKPTSWGSVGTYILAIRTTEGTNVAQGATYAGSTLRSAGILSRGSSTANGYYTPTNSGDTLSGTWQAMGASIGRPSGAGDDAWYYGTLFLRIS